MRPSLQSTLVDKKSQHLYLPFNQQLFSVGVMKLGDKIKHYREGLGWTLDHLSELSGVEKGTISALEVRKSLRSQYSGQIAAAFGLSVDQLLSKHDFLRELQDGADIREHPTTTRIKDRTEITWNNLRPAAPWGMACCCATSLA